MLKKLIYRIDYLPHRRKYAIRPKDDRRYMLENVFKDAKTYDFPHTAYFETYKQAHEALEGYWLEKNYEIMDFIGGDILAVPMER